MKKITKISTLLMVFGTLLVSACGTKSSSSFVNSSSNGDEPNPSSVGNSSSESKYNYEETLNPVTVNSIKEALVHMNKEKNFTLDIYANKQLYYSIYYTDKYIGSDSQGAIYMNMFVEDSKGIYTLNLVNDNVSSGEYELDEDENNVQGLYTCGLYPVFLGVSDDYVNGFDADAKEATITNKKWKLTFIQSIGFTATSYVNLDYIKATYIEENHSVSFEVSFNSSKYLYTVVATNFGSTINEHYRNFMKDGGTVFTPNQEQKKMRELLRSNNFVRMTYDFDNEGYISNEYFHDHYFYTKYISSVDTYYGYMSMNHKSTGDGDADLCGCYYFNVDATGPHFNSQAFSTNPNIPEFMHYPSYMSLLNKLQYMVPGGHKDVKMYNSPGSSRYTVFDEKIIKDFAKNFSLDQTWDFDQAPPYALVIELELKDTNIVNNVITFHYLMKYGGVSYDYPMPIYSFGKADNPTLDKIYEMYND